MLLQNDRLLPLAADSRIYALNTDPAIIEGLGMSATNGSVAADA